MTPPTTLTADDVYRFERVATPALHPDGTSVAYGLTVADRDTDGYRSQVWLAAADGSGTRALTEGPDDSAPAWSPDGQWLAFVRRPKDAPPQLWVLPAMGGDAQLVDAGPVMGYAWAPDSASFAVVRLVDLRGEAADDEEKARRAAEPIVIDRFGYKADGAGLIGPRRTHLFVVTRTGDAAVQLTDGDFSVAGPAWSPDSQHIAVATAIHESRDLDAISHVMTIDVSDGEQQIVTDWEGLVGWVGWLDDDRLLLSGLERVETNLHNALFIVPAAGGKPEPLLRDLDRNVMVGGPGYPGAPPQVTGDRVVFCARDHGTVHLYSASLDSGAWRKVIGRSDHLISGCSVVGDQFAVVEATPMSPGGIVLCTLDNGGERRLTQHNRFLDERTIARAHARTFDVAGTQVHGRILRRDDAPSPGPVLLDIHGGPHNAWGPSLDDVHLYHQVLAAQGWTVVMLNTVGSDGYGQDWYAGLREWGRSDEAQFLEALDQLVAEGIADPARIAVTGYSYGGYMTNWLVTRTDRFAAAVTGGCTTDLASFYGTSDMGPLLLASELRADLHEDPQRFTALSPLTRAADVTTPTLILHGEEDHRCPVGQAEEWFATLRRAGTEVRMVRYPGAGHLFILIGRPSHRVHYNEQVLAWLGEHVAAS